MDPLDPVRYRVADQKACETAGSMGTAYGAAFDEEDGVDEEV